MTKSPISHLLSRDALAIFVLAIFPFVFFWQVTLGQGVWLTTDILRLFYPYGVELARALSHGRLPLWTPDIQSGFPILAEGQIAALYPPNWFLYKLLPPATALSFGMVLHLAWAGCGMYAWTRTQGLRVSAAFLAGWVVAFNGTVFGQLAHPPIIAAMAWLPWLLFLFYRFTHERHPQRASIWFILAVVAFGLQFLCGSVQIAFLNTLAFCVIAFIEEIWRTDVMQPWTARVIHSIKWIALLAMLGGGIAMIQLLPTSELIGYSVRSGGAGQEFALSYSLPTEFLPQFVFPYTQGEPSEPTSEYWAYLGIVPLLLALVAPIVRRERRTIFYLVFVLGTLSFALGDLNPVYQWVARFPPFDFFRVPARYLYLTVFAAAFLAALALDELSSRWGNPARASFVFVIAPAFALWLGATQSLESWLAMWQVLPWLFALAAIVMLLLARKKIAQNFSIGLLIALSIFDLACYAPPFLATIDVLSPSASVNVASRSIIALQTTPMDWRVLTDDSVFPSPPALRGSLFPNTALTYDWQSAQVYSSLAFGAQSAYLANLSPTMLNLLNVRYLMIPLEPRSQTKSSVPSSPLALDILNNETIISPTRGTAIELQSYTEQAAALTDGTVVGEMDVRSQDGRITTLPIRVGIETADWDYESKLATNAIQHSRAPIAHSFPAYGRAFGKTFDGHAFLARWSLPALDIVGVAVRATLPEVHLSIEGVNIIDEQGSAHSLATLADKNNFSLAFMSDTVAVWENHDRLPRAFIAHSTEIVSDDAAFARMRDANFNASQVVLLVNGQAMADTGATRDSVAIIQEAPEQITLTAVTERAGYLVLTDSWYPGWQAFVDGVATPIERADVIFRAVALTPGSHKIEFTYQPLSFVIGVVISVASLIITALIGLRFSFLCVYSNP